jgi:hypothetical protein
VVHASSLQYAELAGWPPPVENPAARSGKPDSMAAMSFHDLPDNWSQHPVTDPALTHDIVDLLVRDEDRRGGAMVILICGEDERLVQPLCVSEIDETLPAEERPHLFDVLVQAMGDQPGGLLVCRARPGGARPNDDDRLWHQTALDTLRGTSVRLLGFHVATPGGVEELPRPLEATA